MSEALQVHQRQASEHYRQCCRGSHIHCCHTTRTAETWEQSSPNNTSSAFYWHTSMLMNGKPCKGQYSEDHPLALTAVLDVIPLEIWKVPSSLS